MPHPAPPLHRQSCHLPTGRRSPPAGHFDRECGWALRNAVSVATCSRVCRQIQPVPKILSQRKLRPKKLILLHLIFSYVCSFLYAPANRICSTETQLTLCGSATGYCAGASKKRKQNV